MESGNSLARFGAYGVRQCDCPLDDAIDQDIDHRLRLQGQHLDLGRGTGQPVLEEVARPDDHDVATVHRCLSTDPGQRQELGDLWQGDGSFLRAVHDAEGDRMLGLGLDGAGQTQ